MMEEVKTNRISGYKAPSQSPSPKTWQKDPEKLRLPEGWVAPWESTPRIPVTSEIVISTDCLD
jgi:hypothetical protein